MNTKKSWHICWVQLTVSVSATVPVTLFLNLFVYLLIYLTSLSVDDNGNVKFQPLYKSCHVNRIPTHLLLSYRNISVVSDDMIRQ